MSFTSLKFQTGSYFREIVTEKEKTRLLKITERKTKFRQNEFLMLGKVPEVLTRSWFANSIIFHEKPPPHWNIFALNLPDIYCTLYTLITRK